MNFTEASLQDVISILEKATNLEYTSNSLVILYNEIGDEKTKLKILIAYDIVVAKKASERAIKNMDRFQELFDYEESIGI